MQLIVEKRGYRVLPLIALAILALVVGIMNVGAVHNEALLELDGNTAFNGGSGFNPGVPPGDNITTAATFDWNSICERGPSGDIQPVAGQTDADVATCARDYGNPDTSYHTGSDKDHQNVSDPANPSATDVWGCVTAANPLNKNDILNAYAALAENASGDTILYFGQERDTNNGDAFVGFWFLQDDVGVPSPCDSDPFTGVHEEGDVLILANYTNGGTIGSIGAFLWTDPDGDTTTPGTCTTGPLAEDTLCTLFVPGAADCRNAAPIDLLCGRINSGPSPVAGRFSTPWEPRDAASCPTTGKAAGCLDVNTFFEGGLNLTDVLALAGRQVECLGTFVAETRSSTSTDATLKDFALGEFDTCGNIIVCKQTDPANSPQSFEFDPSYGANFFLTDASNPPVVATECNDSGDLQPGSYSVSETVPAGWDLASAVCDDGSPVGAIDLDQLETITCTFTNVERGNIIVCKQTDPAGSSQSFEFDPSYGANFFLTDASNPPVVATQCNDSGLLVAGTYSVSEIVPAEWDLTSSSCNDGSLVSAIGLGAGETVTCTFNDRQRGHIIVCKQTDPAGSPQSFEFDPSYGANFFLTDASNPPVVATQCNNSGALVPGTYSVSEIVPAEWDLTSSSCNDGSLVSAIGLGAGETVTCTFNDRQRGHIIVCKQTNPAGSSQSFEFDPSYGANFFLTDASNPPVVATECNDSGPLVPGTYSVSEIVPTGWTLTSSSCSDGSAVSAIGLSSGETVTCTFNNVSLFKLVIYTCDTTTEKLIISTVNPGAKSTVSLGTLPALSGKTAAEVEAYLCEVLGATGAFYDNLPSGTHTRDTIIP